MKVVHINRARIKREAQATAPNLLHQQLEQLYRRRIIKKHQQLAKRPTS